MTLADTPLAEFDWTPQPAAEAWVKRLVDRTLAANAWARTFADRLAAESGNRFIDLLDFVIVPDDRATRQELESAGFVAFDAGHNPPCPAYRHPGGLFPTVLLADHPETDVGIKVENVIDFAVVHSLPEPPAGKPASTLRWQLAARENGVNVYAVERRGSDACDLPMDFPDLDAQAAVYERFRTRRRNFEDDAAGFDHLEAIIDEAVAQLGPHVACHYFFAAEREYWQQRNTAAKVQKARQDRLGIGWANHDHHTYRSSRVHFARLVRLWEKLGLTCRERFYAGKEAGWGAQVMESPVTGIVTFNDVDLSPEELMGDFSHDGLSPREELGTIGLWCGLHGEAVLQAGMHHLECTFDFAGLSEQLEKDAGIRCMKPFTNFPHLKQAFTEGEVWPVAEGRLQKLLSGGYITPEQAETFRKNGALGSHLENLERNAGFKGFNQKGVSEIIADTDPRKRATV